MNLIKLRLSEISLHHMNANSITFEFHTSSEKILITRRLFNRLLKEGEIEGTIVTTVMPSTGKELKWFAALSIF